MMRQWNQNYVWHDYLKEFWSNAAYYKVRLGRLYLIKIIDTWKSGRIEYLIQLTLIIDKCCERFYNLNISKCYKYLCS